MNDYNIQNYYNYFDEYNSITIFRKKNIKKTNFYCFEGNLRDTSDEILLHHSPCLIGLIENMRISKKIIVKDNINNNLLEIVLCNYYNKYIWTIQKKNYQELFLISFIHNTLLFKPPIVNLLKKIEKNDIECTVFNHCVDKKDTLLYKYKKFLSSKKSKFITGYDIYHNKVAKYYKDIGCYMLKYDLKKGIPSVKNFIITNKKDYGENDSIFQFLKVAEDRYVCLYKRPLSLIEAFCVCLTAFYR